MQGGIGTLVSLGMIVRIVLGTFVGCCLFTLAFQLFVMLARETLSSNPEIVGVVALGVGGMQSIAFLVSIVLVALWVHRAHANLHEAGIVGLRYSPAWATASFFIPFINLYVPFASTRELYNRSHGESDWHAAIPAGDVTSWAACNWGALAVFSALVGYLAVDSIPGVFVMLPIWGWIGLSVMLYALLAGSAWFLFQLVRRITGAQEAGLHLSQSDVFA